LKCASNLAELFEEYKNFALLRKQDEMMTGIEVGSESFLVSSKWMKKYMDFLLFEQFQADKTEGEL